MDQRSRHKLRPHGRCAARRVRAALLGLVLGALAAGMALGQQPSNVFFVSAESLRVREGPSGRAAVIAGLERLDPVVVAGVSRRVVRDDEWVEIEHPVRGYVLGRYLMTRAEALEVDVTGQPLRTHHQLEAGYGLMLIGEPQDTYLKDESQFLVNEVWLGYTRQTLPWLGVRLGVNRYEAARRGLHLRTESVYMAGVVQLRAVGYRPAWGLSSSDAYLLLGPAWMRASADLDAEADTSAGPVFLHSGVKDNASEEGAGMVAGTGARAQFGRFRVGLGVMGFFREGHFDFEESREPAPTAEQDVSDVTIHTGSVQFQLTLGFLF